MILCAGNGEDFEFATPIGVGLIDSAINLTKIMTSANPPSKIVFIGSAGSYGNHKIFDIVKSTSASNIELSMYSNLSYTPIDNVLNIESKYKTIVNSSNYITKDTKYNNDFLANGIELENMEFYAVLKVAQHFGTKALGIFVVTNYCDDKAHESFVSNHDKAMKLLRGTLSKEGLIKI